MSTYTRPTRPQLHASSKVPRNAPSIQADFALFVATAHLLAATGVHVGEAKFEFADGGHARAFRKAKAEMLRTGALPRIIAPRLYAANGDYTRGHQTVKPTALQTVSFYGSRGTVGNAAWQTTLWLLPEQPAPFATFELDWSVPAADHAVLTHRVTISPAVDVIFPGLCYAVHCDTQFEEAVADRDWTPVLRPLQLAS
jgi:hypothetical protein